MTNPAPEEKTQIILDILDRHQIAAIVNTAAGGLSEPTNYDKNLVYFISQIPYDWIFPKVYAVMHHGGSGTTHLAIKYGCASLIIPHIIDQFVWNKLIHEKALGPKGIKIGNLNDKILVERIIDLLENPIYKEKAKKYSLQMQGENLQCELLNLILK